MVKNRFLLIPTVMIAAILLVITLAWDALKTSSQNKGFTREYIGTELTLLQTVEKPKDVVDFAGNTDNFFYFKTKSPSKVYVTDKNLAHGKYLNTGIPDEKVLSSLFSCIVDSPYIYILAGNAKTIFKVDQNRGFKAFMFPEGILVRAALISENSIVVRMIDTIDAIFAKKDFTQSKLLKERGISAKNGDAGITTDGSLLYDKETNLLTYIHYFKNEIICLDTNLNLIKKMKTIDTTSAIAMEIGEVSSQNMLTSKTPKKILNYSAELKNDLLYINSKVRADNDNKDIFRNTSIIDVYEIRTGEYKGSFYLPHFNKQYMTKFKIVDDTIIAMYQDNLLIYRMPNLTLR